MQEAPQQHNTYLANMTVRGKTGMTAAPSPIPRTPRDITVVAILKPTVRFIIRQLLGERLNCLVYKRNLQRLRSTKSKSVHIKVTSQTKDKRVFCPAYE